MAGRLDRVRGWLNRIGGWSKRALKRVAGWAKTLSRALREFRTLLPPTFFLLALSVWSFEAYRDGAHEGCAKEQQARTACTTAARDDKDARAACGDVYEDCRQFPADGYPSTTTALFFTAQTITTTGFGSYVHLKFEDVQWIALWGMLVGAFLWALIVGLLVNIISSLLASR